MSRTIRYRSLLVPLADNAETDQALDVACRLAAEHGASITAVAVIEVPPVLPLTAHMFDEEARAKLLLRRAESVGESYGVHVVGRVVRGREAGEVVADEAAARRVDLVVVGARRRGRRPFGHTVETILRVSPCRVLVIAPPAEAVPARVAA
jgi:nucleotide-binding universal stress UspA family protein